jgi:hypothetical protein
LATFRRFMALIARCRGRMNLYLISGPLSTPRSSIAAIQSVHVLGADDGEVAPIRAGYVGQIQPFGHRDDGRVYGTQREVGVGANKFGGSRQIGSGDGDMLELTCYNRLQESGLDVGAFLYQPADLNDYCGRDQKRAAKGLQESGTACMVLVRAVDGRNERAGVEKRCHAERFIRSRMISSRRSERSSRPESQMPMIDDLRPVSCSLSGLEAARVQGRLLRDAQPFRLARGESIDQVVQILVVGRCRHNRSLRLAVPAYRKRQS